LQPGTSKNQDQIKKALVELARRPEGRQLLESLDKKSVVIPLNTLQKIGDLGKHTYGHFDPTQAKRPGSYITGTATVTLDFGLAKKDKEVDRAAQETVGLPANPTVPQSDAKIVDHELTHGVQQFDERSRFNSISPEERKDDATDRSRAISKEKPDLSEKEAKKFIDKILEPKGEAAMTLNAFKSRLCINIQKSCIFEARLPIDENT
jgi:hypothetical protein